MNLIKTKNFELAVYARGDKSSDKLALVLPGRLDTKDYAHNISHVDYFASRGYFALSFDPPGTWGSPGEIELYTMTNYLKAINELIELFGNNPAVLMGHSRGGSMAMLAGPKNKNVTHIIAALSNTGPSTLTDETKKTGVSTSFRDMPPNDSKNKKRFDLPISYFEDANQYGIREELISCTKPKLFFYGIRDNVVAPEKVQNVYEACVEPKMIHELNTDHDYRRHPDIIEEINTVIGKFLDSELGE